MKLNDVFAWRLASMTLLFSTLAAFGQANYAVPYTFTTVAGNAGYGSADGTGSAARFYFPVALAMDGTSNIYVADLFNNTIRKIAPGGVVTTLAGLAGASGSNDGTGINARFNAPDALTTDSFGNIYVADAGNNTIRKVTPAGVVSTLAGLAGSPGSVDGTGGVARFNSPNGLAVDSVGDVYVADANNYTVRKVTSAGVVTTLAGLAGSPGSADGTGSAARFYEPGGGSVDRADNFYVADQGNHTIRRITPAGVVTTLAGLPGSSGSADGTGSAARFNGPADVAVDSAGNVYVADQGNNTIRKIASAGVVTTLAGLAGSPGNVDGTGSAARFAGSSGVAVDSAGNVYVADTGNNSVRKVIAAASVTTLAGMGSSSGSVDGAGSAARFNDPESVAVDGAGNIYVADANNDTIRKVTAAGVVTTLAGLADSSGSADGTGSAARFNVPCGVAVDGASNIYVADIANQTIRKVTPAGVVTTLAGLAGNIGNADGTGSAARFGGPSGVAVDSGGNLYVAERGNRTIRRITPAGVVTTLAGLAGSSGSADGTGSAARFNGPSSVAVDGAGNLYVADTDNFTIREVTPAGAVTTLAGAVGIQDSVDGVGSNARFFQPEGVAVDSAADVYVADGFTIRKITPDGVVTTMAGLAGGRGSYDGTGSAARFAGPSGVAVDSAGNVYVADTANNTIRKGFREQSAVIVSTEPGFGYGAGQFQFGLIGSPGQPVGIQVSDDLTTWQPLWTNTFLTGSMTFTDTNAAPHRFYRAVSP